MKKSVLIADTQENTRETLKHILSHRFPLILVESPAHGLEVLTRGKTPAALAFIGLNDETGTSTRVFAEIRGRFPDLTVIAVGDHKSDELAVEAVRQGATGYMIKPFKPDEIIAAAEKSC